MAGKMGNVRGTCVDLCGMLLGGENCWDRGAACKEGD